MHTTTEECIAGLAVSKSVAKLWFVKSDLADGFHGGEAVLVEPTHVSGTAEKFAAGGGVHAVLGQGPGAPGPRPKGVAGAGSSPRW